MSKYNVILSTRISREEKEILVDFSPTMKFFEVGTNFMPSSR